MLLLTNRILIVKVTLNMLSNPQGDIKNCTNSGLNFLGVQGSADDFTTKTLTIYEGVQYRLAYLWSNQGNVTCRS